MTGTSEQDGDATVTGDARIITPGAERMRRSRERHRQGDRVVSLEVDADVIADLVASGWLSDGPDRRDNDALNQAVSKLIDRAIELRVTPAAGTSGKLGFFAEIPAATIERLTSHGWVAADQRNDPSAIVAALRRFVGGVFEIP
jgi:hypothetical protein